MSTYVERAINEQTKVLQGILEELRKVNERTAMVSNPVRLSDFGHGLAGTLPSFTHSVTEVPHSHAVGPRFGMDLQHQADQIVEVSPDELRHWGGASIGRQVRTR